MVRIKKAIYKIGFPFLLVCLSCGVLWFLNNRVNHQVELISKEPTNNLLISPSRDKILIDQKNGQIIVFDINKEKPRLIERKANENRTIYSVEWLNNNELIAYMEDHTTNTSGIYKTIDLVTFHMVNEYKKDVLVLPSPNYLKFVTINMINQKIIIGLKNGENWNVQINFKITGALWSRDSEYILISDSKETYLLNTKIKSIKHINKSFDAIWASQKNIIVFYTDGMGVDSYGFDEGLYLFNADDSTIVKFNTANCSPKGARFIWSQDNHYFLMVDTYDIYLFNVKTPKEKPRHLISFDKVIEPERTVWSDDQKNVFFTYFKTTNNLAKQLKYYAAKLNIENGKMKKIYLDGTLSHEFIWVRDDLVYYDNEIGLCRKELKW